MATPNFDEHFITQSIQPFVEYDWKITPRLTFTAGIKSAAYTMNLIQYQDNGGKGVGCLGGKLVNKIRQGGAQFTTHGVGYNSWLPSAALHYLVKSNWSAYAQYGTGR